MFSLNQQTAKLVNVNPRSEIHGDEYKLATDLKFEIRVGNEVLSEFAPSLKSSIYRAADPGEGDLLANEPGNLPKIKFPLLGPLKYGWEGAGYATTVHWGISGKADILMIQTKIDNFKFDCQDGGTVAVSFRVIAHPEPEELGRLCEMIQQEVSLSLDPPSAEEQYQQQMKDLEDEDE